MKRRSIAMIGIHVLRAICGLVRRPIVRLPLALIVLRCARIRLAARAILPNIDVEPLDTNVLFRQPIAQSRQMIQ